MDKSTVGGMTTFLLPENMDTLYKAIESTTKNSMMPENDPLESSSNGVAHNIKPPGSAMNSRARQNKAPELHMIERKNWHIHLLYVRKSFDECKKIIREQLEETKGMCEYANYVQGLIHRQVGRIQESFELFQLCNILNPNSVENLKQMARSLSLLGRHKLATEAYIQAERKCDKPDWEILHNLGVCYLYMKDVNKAKEQLSLALDQNKHPLSFTILAKIYQSEGDISRAIVTYRSAVEHSPENADLQTSLGLLYMQAGNYQHAFEHLGTALTFDSKHSKAILAAGSMMQSHQDYDVALSKYRIAAQRLPESAPLWNNIAMCFFGKKKFVAAISCLKRSNYISPFDWKILYNLGLVHLTMQQYASAFHFLSAAVNLKSTKGSIFMLLAVTLTYLDDEENAQSAYEQAMRLDAKDPTVCLNYSIFLLNHGKKIEAIRTFDDFHSRLERYRQSGNDLEMESIEAANNLASELGIESSILNKKSARTHLGANVEAASYEGHTLTIATDDNTLIAPQNQTSLSDNLAEAREIPMQGYMKKTAIHELTEEKLKSNLIEKYSTNESKEENKNGDIYKTNDTTSQEMSSNNNLPIGKSPEEAESSGDVGHEQIKEASISDDDDEEDIV